MFAGLSAYTNRRVRGSDERPLPNRHAFDTTAAQHQDADAEATQRPFG